MKKIYLLTFSLFALTQLNAQTTYTLTQANSEPMIGDSYASKGVDTSTALPMNITGLNITWNCTDLYDTLAVDTNKYISPSADPNSGNYPGVTMVRSNASGSTYFKSTTNKLELLGLDIAFGGNSANLNYDVNPAVLAQYNMSYGFTNTDAVEGSMTAMSFPGTFTGTVNSSLDGTGTLNLNGLSFTDCSRVKTVQNILFDLNAGITTISGSVDQTTYMFYNSSSKFPIFSYNFFHVVTGVFPDQDQVQIECLANLMIGVKETKQNNVIFKLYPNPANSDISLYFVLAQPETYHVEIVNTLGQIVKTITFNNSQPGIHNEAINTADLGAGIYTVKVSGKNKQGTEKLVIQK
ncbi:MAG: T9SS type A sorting domain-containing protein [Bacteroidota bacterium]